MKQLDKDLRRYPRYKGEEGDFRDEKELKKERFSRAFLHTHSAREIYVNCCADFRNADERFASRGSTPLLEKPSGRKNFRANRYARSSVGVTARKNDS